MWISTVYVRLSLALACIFIPFNFITIIDQKIILSVGDNEAIVFESSVLDGHF